MLRNLITNLVSRWRLIIAMLVLFFLAYYIELHPNSINLPPALSTPIHKLTQRLGLSSDKISNSDSVPQNISADRIISFVASQRQSAELAAPQTNTTLEKAARLIALAVEDQQQLTTDLSLPELLKAIGTKQPPELENLTIFVSGFGDFQQAMIDPEKPSKLITQADYQQIGVAVRPAEFQGEIGNIIVILSSPDFVNEAEEKEMSRDEAPAAVRPAPPATTPTFTGQDLWQAVQNYRRAHRLPEFVQANELCTVASIRLNELLELGKLDNHDGFGPRAEEFFERHPDWDSINENLAAGYETAVQTVEWGWDQSLGHQALIKSLDYPKACAAAQRGFAVLITGK